MRDTLSKPNPNRRHDRPVSENVTEEAGSPARRHHHHGQHDQHDQHDHRGHRGEGQRGHRVRRGETRYLLLDALRDGPKHGYEIIKSLEERSSGQYAPSPGSVYPTLQFLEELGFVRANQETERRTYELTRTGKTELEAHVEEVKNFWGQFKALVASKAGTAEVGFLQDELEHLNKTVWSGLRSALDQDDKDTIRRVRQAIERCRNDVRSIISGGTI
jgi:DNA-binding PadR family transcriptional regulator